MTKVKIRKFKVPYTLTQEGDNTDLVMNDADQEELDSEEVDTTNKAIQTLASEIGSENQKEKEIAIAIAEKEGFIIIKKISESV